MRVKRILALVTLPAWIVAAAACSSEPKPEEKPAEAPAAAPAVAPTMAAMPGTVHASFAEPADGATVTSPVHLKFASEGITISPVPAEVKEVRPGMGHYHMAIDTECLASGAEIKKGEAWVHLGKGDTEMDTQLTAGSHKLTVAVGDDKHMQIPGACSTITVNVK
jgi:hypothetical protein